MRVAYVTPFYAGSSDGRFGRFNDWVHALRDMDDPTFDFEVHAFIATDPDETLTSRPHAMLGDGDDLWATKRNTMESLFNAPRVVQDLRRSDADLIHVLTVDPVLTPTVWVAKDGRPIVLGPNVGGWFPLREDAVWERGPVDRARRRAKFAVRKALTTMAYADKHLAFSRYHRQMLEQLGVDPERIEVLYPGVDLRFSPPASPDDFNPDDRPELLYVGDFSEHKGFPVLVGAFDHLERDIRVRLIGGGDPELPETSPVDIVVEGFVPRADLPKYYRRADLVVLPTIDETAGPNTLLEALACGTPVVTTDRPSMNEYAPDEATVLFRPREPRALADAIGRAIENLPALQEAARRHASEFGADRTVVQLSELYRQVLDDRRSQD